MTDDIMYICIGLGAVLFIVATLSALSSCSARRHHGCWHRWSMWTPYEDRLTYTQQRKCEKCGYTETVQERKLGN
jgi:hypothetical protein